MTRAISAENQAALEGQNRAAVFEIGALVGAIDSEWPGWTFRRRFEPSILGITSAEQRLVITFETEATLTIAGSLDEAWIGLAAASGDPYDFDGNQVRIKFNGSNSKALNGAMVFESDPIDFVIDGTRAIVISAFFSGTNVSLATSGALLSGSTIYYKNASDAATTNATGYDPSIFSDSFIKKIESVIDGSTLVARDFVWFVVRDRDTGDPVTDGYWSDVGQVTASVIHPDTGSPVSRTWYGAAGLISISDIPLVSSLSVQNVTIMLSQVADRVNDLVRTYDCKQGRVEIYRGLFDLSTRSMVAPAICRFVGYIDSMPITTPSENQTGDVTLTCTSHTQELTRINPDTRSDASQRLRSATDDFFADVAVVGEWEHFWGKAGKVATSSLGRYVPK